MNGLLEGVIWGNTRVQWFGILSINIIIECYLNGEETVVIVHKQLGGLTKTATPPPTWNCHISRRGTSERLVCDHTLAQWSQHSPSHQGLQGSNPTLFDGGGGGVRG